MTSDFGLHRESVLSFNARRYCITAFILTSLFEPRYNQMWDSHIENFRLGLAFDFRSTSSAEEYVENFNLGLGFLD